MHRSTPSRSVNHGINDVGIARAATKITAHALTNFGFGKIGLGEGLSNVRRGSTRPTGFRLLDHRQRRHDLARGAETTLKSIMLNECLLKRVKPTVLLQPVYRSAWF